MRLVTFLLFVAGMILPWADFEFSRQDQLTIQKLASEVEKEKPLVAFGLRTMEDGILRGYEVSATLGTNAIILLGSPPERSEGSVEVGLLFLTCALAMLFAFVGSVGGRSSAIVAAVLVIGVIIWLDLRIPPERWREIYKVSGGWEKVGLGVWLTLGSLVLSIFRPVRVSEAKADRRRPRRAATASEHSPR